MKWTATIELEMNGAGGDEVAERFVDLFMDGLIEAGAIDPTIYGSLARGTATIELTVDAPDLETAKRIGNELFRAAQPRITGRPVVDLIGESTRRMVPAGV